MKTAENYHPPKKTKIEGTDAIRDPAPMREDPTGNGQPLDRAWTTPKRGVANVVPAPMREDTTRNAQPLDRAWTTPKRRVANVVPAPRLELGTP